jgi:hypothetical protein
MEGLELVTKDINDITRGYYKDDVLVAIAQNPTWTNDIDNILDSMTKYYCIKGIWEPDEQTSIVSRLKLLKLIQRQEYTTAILE